MKLSAISKSKALPRDTVCLVQSVADAIVTDPTLEAVTIDRKRRSISVATLGQADIPKLTERIQETVQVAQAANANRQCQLLEGAVDCRSCDVPNPPCERKDVTIKQGTDAITIARVTCPTAPTFWRWREVPWPKVVQRDVEFLDHAERLDEWKPQLLAAALCGAFGLTAYLHTPGAVSSFAYV